jgi:DNA processing protein
MTADERAAFLRLALTPGIGPIRLARLHDAFGSYAAALAAPFALLIQVPGFSTAGATAVATSDPAGVARALDRAEAVGATVLTRFDPTFPSQLLTLPDPPAVLFLKGRLELLDRPAVAVVGSRDPTDYGRRAAHAVASSAATAGLVVVSGMARGLDAVAHGVALDAGGGSIGVLGNGIGVIYPAANRRLYQRMAADGLLLTEHPPGERPHAGSFPQRNRLISGLARITVVVEAAYDSGAMNTVRQALGQGRDVMAVPGPITSPTSAGTNGLIRDGAGPWLDPDDLLGHYPEVSIETRARLRDAAGRDERAARLRADLRRVYQLLDEVPRSTDEVAERLELAPGEALSLLTELEIDGAVERRDQGFVRALS